MERPIEYRTSRSEPRLAETAGAIGRTARQKGQRTAAALEQFIVRKPAVAMGIALALGVLVGWWIKRR